MKLPEPPLIAAGALGGPICMYMVSPFRNALTLASRDASLSLVGVSRQVFAHGIRAGWVGGAYPSIAAGPQYLCLGPMFHLYASLAGNVGGVILAGCTETLCGYGAETKCAQLVVNRNGGAIPSHRIQSIFKPFGPGVGINCIRNIIAMSGMRVMSKPMQDIFTRTTGSKSPLVACLADLSANCCAAGATMPLHMLYQYAATSHDMWDRPLTQRLAGMREFLNRQYFPNGRLSSVILRDTVLRMGFVATAFTLYQQVERAAVDACSTQWYFGIGGLSFSALEEKMEKARRQGWKV
jgi:hypothetical protein